jgi:hypothetical protein
MPVTTRGGTFIVAAIVVASTAWSSGTSAEAKDGSSSAQVSVMCGPIATTLALKARNGAVEAQYTLDESRKDRVWKLVLTRNGATVARAARSTQAPSGALHWRVTSAGLVTDTFRVTARHGSANCAIEARVESGSSTGADRITVSKCYTNATAKTGGELLIKASSSDPNARLFAYRPDGSLIGEVQNGGGGRYGGTVMPYQASDPGSVTISSSSGGSVTVATGPFQL